MEIIGPGLTYLSDEDIKFLHSGAEYFNILLPVSNGYMAALQNHNEFLMIFYSESCISITNKFLPIISGYQVSDKVRLLQNELILEMESHRSAQDNYLQSIQCQDLEQKVVFLKTSFNELTKATKHFNKIKVIENQLKINFI